MLKVTLDVNGKKIGEFQIIDIGSVGEKRIEYKVSYFRKPGEYVEIFYVVHHLEEGVEVLVKKVLDKFLSGNDSKLLERKNVKKGG